MRLAASAVLASALLFPFCLPVLKAQSPARVEFPAGSLPVDLATPASFAEEPVLLRSTSLVMQYNADGTGARTETQAFTVQSEAAVRTFGVIGLAYASASQNANFVYVRVRHPDGTVVETPLSDVQDQTPPVTREAPFYSDLKQKQLPVRGLRVGDTIEWQSRTDLVHPEVPNQFWDRIGLVRDLVTLQQNVELRVPAAMNVNVWTNPANHLTPQKSREGDQVVYRWQWQSLNPTVGKEAETAKKAKEGKLLTADEEMDELNGRLPDIAYTTFPSWAAVGNWYRKLQVERTEPDAAIRARVAQITANATTEEDKVRAVYDWVAANIRYVGVAFGIGRFQPHTASAVLENQYGDCKDKHTLLASMLRVLGEQPDAVLIGSGIRFNEAVPSPDSFNHLITHVSVGGKPIFLDTTAEVAGYQVLVPQIRDKAALVIPATGTPTIQHTPAASPFAPTSEMVVRGKLDKDLTSDSEITYTFHDDDQILLRALLRQASPGQYPEFVQKLMEGFGFGGTTSEVAIDNLNNQEKPLVLHFHYRRVRSTDWGENRVSVTFGPTQLANVDDKKPPTRSIRLGPQRVFTSTVDMELPEGWSAELPEAIHQQIPEVRIDTVYHLDGRNLHAERKTAVLQEKIPARDWPEYHAWYDKASAGNVPYLKLIPPKSTRATEALVTGAMRDESQVIPGSLEDRRRNEAAGLIASADIDLQHNEPVAAEKHLLAAKKLNENQRLLWCRFGELAAQRGDKTEAMRLYRKEVELYPDSDQAWYNMVWLQMQSNPGAAAATAREWVAAGPLSPSPRENLFRALWADGQNAAALTAVRAAMVELPSEMAQSTEYQLLLGEAQMRAGIVASGAQTLAQLVGSNATPSQRNDAAYELAKAHQQVPLAESTERQVLKELEEETLTWTGNESPDTMRYISNLLTASWDTMGWILFQEQKYAEAQPYIYAAWLYRANPEVGEHLGDVETALNHDKQAQNAYQSASTIAQRCNGAISSDLKRKAEAASASAAARNAGTGKQCGSRNDEHIFSVTAANSVSGSAQYQILIRPERIVSIKPLNNDGGPALDAILRKADLASLFPKGESAALFGKVYLNCNAGKCNLQLEP